MVMGDDKKIRSVVGSPDRPEIGFVSGGSKKDRAKRKKKQSTRQEDRMGNRKGGRRVPYSGGKSMKGDSQWAGFLFEHKRTKHKSIRIGQKVIEKIFLESIDEGMDWAIQVDVDGIDDAYMPHRFVILTEEKFVELAEAAGRVDEG
jgi:VCBS repeat-containing protein